MLGELRCPELTLMRSRVSGIFLYIQRKKGVLYLIEIIGMFAGILTTCAFFPQVVKTVKSKSTDDLSWTWLVMMIAGVFLWLVYGYYIKSSSLFFANIITFVSVSMLFGVKYSNHRKKKHL